MFAVTTALLLTVASSVCAVAVRQITHESEAVVLADNAYPGAPTSAIYPPPSATVNSALFPGEDQLGYAGPTPSTLRSCSLNLNFLAALIDYLL